MKRIIFVCLLAFTACNKAAKVDSARLDGLISSGQIERVEITQSHYTNVLTGTAAQQYVLLFHATNRVAKGDWTKSNIGTIVVLMSATQKLCAIERFDNGLYQFGDYTFQLRSSP
jgi:glutamine cyclotransferase